MSRPQRGGNGNGRQYGGFDRDSESSPGAGMNYHNMTEQQLEQRRQEELVNQDAMLDQIHRGVKGLRNQANAINGEVVEQNVMIDDIGNRMDAAQVDIERQERHAREVNAKKKKACKLYGVIAILVLILILLFAIPE